MHPNKLPGTATVTMTLGRDKAVITIPAEVLPHFHEDVEVDLMFPYIKHGNILHMLNVSKDGLVWRLNDFVARNNREKWMLNGTLICTFKLPMNDYKFYTWFRNHCKSRLLTELKMDLTWSGGGFHSLVLG